MFNFSKLIRISKLPFLNLHRTLLLRSKTRTDEMFSKTIINSPLEYSLRLFGAWPHSSYTVLKMTFWSVIMIVFLVFQGWYCVTHIKSNLIDLLDGLCLTLSNSLVFLKLIVIWLHSRTFCAILTTVFEDYNKFAATTDDKRILAKKAIVSSRISNFLIGYYAITFLIYAGIALSLFDEKKDTSVSKQRKFLIRMEFPFEATVSPRYEIILCLQFIFESFIVYGASTSIALIAVLILHAGNQIDLLCQKLNEISHSYKTRELRKLAIRDIIVRHQRIIRFFENIETIFTYISLYQFLSNMLVICFVSFILAFSIRTEQATEIIIKCFPYYVAINCEAFVLCYTGEYLASKSETISESVYNFLWYNLEPKEARTILLILLRSQSQLVLTAGKFVNLSLQAFANMLKGSASYLSVLYATY